MPAPDPAWITWLSLAAERGWPRVKAQRTEPLSPGGRCRLTLFESVDDGRPHPRLRVSLPPVVDPSPPGPLFPAHPVPSDASSFEAALERALSDHARLLSAADVDLDRVDPESRRFYRASIAGQRREDLFAQARSSLRAHSAQWPVEEQQRAAYRLEAARDRILVGAHPFDDADTGTYHSFGKDEPFVHVLIELLEGVPEPGSDAFDRLPTEQQQAVRAQRRQCLAHLDALMRRKYAYHGVDERDIEHSIGGRLIDRTHRQVVTTVASEEGLAPRLLLLRIRPDADHPHAGAWVYRTPGELASSLRRKDGSEIQVDASLLREIPVDPAEVTFERHRGRLIRRGVHFDWDGDGLVAAEPIPWVDWAGHCDLKAIQEAVGLTLTGSPRPVVREHRSDTGKTTLFSRGRLLEVLTALLELGSVYQTFDGSEPIVRGVTHFGGARNDSLPDRIQFQGLSPGRSFRWPLERDREAFTLVQVEGASSGIDVLFRRHEADGEAMTMVANPRFMKVVEGDYNVVDVSGLKLSVTARMHSFDQDSGAYRRRTETLEIDLSRTEGRTLLGTHLHDAALREIYRVWLDHAQPAIVAVLERLESVGEGAWSMREVPEKTVVIPLVKPLSVTASREVPADDPGAFQALLEAALRRGEGIVADTDARAPVWNGVVTHIEVAREAADPTRRIERWRVDFKARFGDATLRYLVRRNAEGRPVDFAALPAEGDAISPDFLWQDFPDVASKGRENGTWIVNRSMVERGIVELRPDSTVAGGTYVHDEHIKNMAEILWCGLSGHHWTLVHNNKRYAFLDEADWLEAIGEATQAREALSHAGGEPLV